MINTRSIYVLWICTGKASAVHLLVDTKTEVPAKVGAKEINSPGLQLLLEFSPNLELCDMNSDTPLTIAVCNRDIDKVQLLVSDVLILRFFKKFDCKVRNKSERLFLKRVISKNVCC